jgi:hypothetical protein
MDREDRKLFNCFKCGMPLSYMDACEYSIDYLCEKVDLCRECMGALVDKVQEIEYNFFKIENK